MDETIYVAQPDLLRLDEDEVDFADLNNALADEAESATAIIIFGGYYNKDFLVSLIRRVPGKPVERRRKCRIRIVVGLEATSMLPRVWEELQNVGRTLRREGFADIGLWIVPRDPVHFHTKLFGFIHATRPAWYVGSANPGSKRHELMLRLSGRHRALSAYVEAAYKRALPITAGSPPNFGINTLRGFLLAGVLCHKPPPQRLFTFDAFRFRPEQRAMLDRVLGQGVDVPHARPRTEGYGFSLASALGLESVQADDGGAEDGGGSRKRIHYRESCVDTSLGLWMPTIYAAELRASFVQEEEAREGRLEKFAAVINCSDGMKRARGAFNNHLIAMTRFLGQHKIDAHPVPSHKELFERFLVSRSRILESAEARKRHSRMMILTDMPDIWDDSQAVQSFEGSFFADLAYRAGTLGSKKGRVIKSITEALARYGAPDSDEEIREAMKQKLRSRAWRNEDWLKQNEQ